ncbi:hypothetical protein AALB16_12955 [Lachnospiraceae bacterium 62-35]
MLLAGLTGCSKEADSDIGGEKQEIVFDEKADVDEEFIKVLSQGLMDRWDYMNTEDENELEPSKFAEYGIKVVNCELDNLQPFYDLNFSDTDLKGYARTYMDLLKKSIEAVSYYETDFDTYISLWDKIYIERILLLDIFVSEYDLNVSESYQDTLQEMVNTAEAVKLLNVKAEVLPEKYREENGYKISTIKVTNDTSNVISTIGLAIAWIDREGTIIDSGFAYSSTAIQIGQSAYVEALTNNENAEYISVTEFLYNTPSDESYQGNLLTPFKPIALGYGDKGDRLQIVNSTTEDSSDSHFNIIYEIKNISNNVIHFKGISVKKVDHNGNIADSHKNVNNDVDIEPGKIFKFKVKLSKEDNISYIENEKNIYKNEDGKMAEMDFSEPYRHIMSQTNDPLMIRNEQEGETYKYYSEAITIKKNKLTESPFGHYKYKDITILNEDREWIDSTLNTDGIADQGTLYRSFAKILVGFSMGNNWEGYAEHVIGFIPGSKEEFEPYVQNAMEFIVMDENPLEYVMRKFESLASVEGSFNHAGRKYSFYISNLSECAAELKISEEMLGYILAMLDEYGQNVSFDGNSYTLSLE